MTAVPTHNGRRGYVVQHTATMPTEPRRETPCCAEANGGAIGVPPSPTPQGESTDAGSGPACQHNSTGDES